MNKESKVLCMESQVAIKSLPRCLRHYRVEVSLEDAARLTKMLHILFMAFEAGEWKEKEEGLKGVDLVLRLLLDKIEIASGEYKFPLLSHDSKAPALVEREKEGAA